MLTEGFFSENVNTTKSSQPVPLNETGQTVTPTKGNGDSMTKKIASTDRADVGLSLIYLSMKQGGQVMT